MTFEEYWQSRIARQLPTDANARAAVEDAWDAALEAARAASHEKGQPRDIAASAAAISALHTWA